MQIFTICLTQFFLPLLLLGAYSPAVIAVKKIVPSSNQYPWSFTQGFAIGAASASLLALVAILTIRRKYLLQQQHIINKVAMAKEAAQKSNLAHQSLLAAQQDSQDNLEDSVQERTLELHIALQELEDANKELERINTIDELSGLHNRRFYDQKILAEYRRSKRNLTPLSLVIIDIDHFKKVNDNYGHLTGDHCLIWISQHIKQSLKRSSDLAFRYGGEEFCLILPDTDAKGAQVLADDLRKSIAKQAFEHEGTEIAITISCGIGTYQQQKNVQPAQIFSGADAALYQAKNNGRNQVQQHQFIEEE
ncbi:MAG: diguanylate cyclase [Colwellia sp.]